MDAILQTLQDLEGVNGAFIADQSGQVLAYRAHAVYDSALLNRVSQAVVTAIDSVRLLHDDWESVTVQFSDGKLLIRSLTAGNSGKIPPLTLSVIADVRLNLSFAGVAIRVATAKLKAIFETGVNLQDLASSSTIKAAAPAPRAAPPPMAPAYGAIPTNASNPDMGSNGLNWSGLGASSPMMGSGVAAIDAASAAVLATCTKALARSVGPMAKRYVKEALTRVCGDRPFARDMAPMLVVELEKYLEDPAHAGEFRKAALKAP